MLRALKLAPVPVTLLILSFLCPTEFSLFLGGLRLPPHRVALIVLFGFALVRWMTRRDIRVRSFDVMFACFSAWTVFVFSSHDPGGGGLVYGGSQALESFGAYLIARVYIRDIRTLQLTLKVLIMAIGVAALFALPETLLGRNFTHDFLASVTGYHHPTAVEHRLGMTRAYGTFDHPIHYGTFCGALLALFWFSEPKATTKRWRAGLLTGATVLGVSSAPLLGLAMQAGMIVWERVTRPIAARTLLTISILAGLYIGVSLVSSRSPAAIIATGFTLDSWTGFYRLQIWEHGLQNVWGSPWFGIGLAEWDRPWWMVSSTVDAFWLVIAMRTGIPAFMLLAAAIILLSDRVVSQRRRAGEPGRDRIVLGWMMSLIALCLVGLTVHYWNVLYSFFFFFLGLGGFLADPKPVRRARMARERQGRQSRRGRAHEKRGVREPVLPGLEGQAPGGQTVPGYGRPAFG